MIETIEKAEETAGGDECATHSRTNPHCRERHVSPWYFGIFHKNLNEHKRVGANQAANYGSISTALTTEQKIVPAAHVWQKLNEYVTSSEFLLRHNCEHGEESAHLTDLAKGSYEFRIRECFLIFVALLAVGGLAYSFVFERWTIIDSLYFTVVMLTTCGFGDITPTTPGGKLFASLFAIAGIVLLGLILGVVGSNLIEAEVAYARKMQTDVSCALDRAFSKRSSRKRIEDDVEYDSEVSDTISTCSSVDYQEFYVKPRNSSIIGRIRAKMERNESSWYYVLVGEVPAYALLLLSGLAMGLMEHRIWYDNIYFCVVTATTIGFGDLVPTSEYSRAFAIIFIPIAVASMGYITGDIASFIVEKRRADFFKGLWSAEIGIDDIDALDVNHDGEVSELEFIKFMLVSMRKIDGELFDDLRHRFEELDSTGDGKITKEDILCSARKKATTVKNKLILMEYKKSLMRR